MNFDLIKKLIQLANNNPSENEANLAARKVCRMLDEYKFEQPSPSKNGPFGSGVWNRPASSSSPYSDIYNDIFTTMKNKMNEDQKRRDEAKAKEAKKAKEQPKQDPIPDFRGVDWAYVYWDETNEEEIHKKCPKCGSSMYISYTGYQYECTNTNCNFIETVKDRYTKPPNKPKSDTAKVRTCVECGTTVYTRRITNVFRCNKCEWGEYNKTKPAAEGESS